MKTGNFLKRFINYYHTYGLARLSRRAYGVAFDTFARRWMRNSRDEWLSKLPEEAEHHLPPIIILAGIEWSYRIQRAQQLARSFAKSGSMVFYCEPVFAASHKPGWCAQWLTGEKRICDIKFLLPKRVEIWEHEVAYHFTSQIKKEVHDLVNSIKRISAIDPVIIVQNPYWSTSIPYEDKVCIIYDCLDDFNDFDNTYHKIDGFENKLLQIAHGIVSTSKSLDSKWKSSQIPHRIIRNGVDFDHFNKRPSAVYAAQSGKGIIGYHGAIENWFDVGLVEEIATNFPDYTIVLVGGISNFSARRSFKRHNNIQLIGEVPYQNLPYYLHSFDVAIIPFLIRPLTVATNPIKAYEYLAAGIPVVATPLPEMKAFGGLVAIADRDGFIEKLHSTLLKGKRLANQYCRFASQNSWMERASDFYDFHNEIISIYSLN